MAWLTCSPDSVKKIKWTIMDKKIYLEKTLYRRAIEHSRKREKRKEKWVSKRNKRKTKKRKIRKWVHLQIKERLKVLQWFPPLIILLLYQKVLKTFARCNRKNEHMIPWAQPHTIYNELFYGYPCVLFCYVIICRFWGIKC